jgi:hypothetical protein
MNDLSLHCIINEHSAEAIPNVERIVVGRFYAYCFIEGFWHKVGSLNRSDRIAMAFPEFTDISYGWEKVALYDRNSHTIQLGDTVDRAPVDLAGQRRRRRRQPSGQLLRDVPDFDRVVIGETGLYGMLASRVLLWNGEDWTTTIFTCADPSETVIDLHVFFRNLVVRTNKRWLVRHSDTGFQELPEDSVRVYMGDWHAGLIRSDGSMLTWGSENSNGHAIATTNPTTLTFFDNQIILNASMSGWKSIAITIPLVSEPGCRFM